MKYFKLNNRGWGLRVMLASIFVLMIGLMIVAILIQQTFGDVFESSSGNGGSINHPVVDDDKDEEPSTPKYTYEELEDLVLDATKEYQKKYYQDILDGEKITVTLKQLINEKLIDEVKDVQDDTLCSGYGLFSLDDGEMTYKAYLKCSNHITIGYNEIYDFN